MAAAQFAQLALNGAVPLIKNYDVIYDKTKETIKRTVRGKSKGRDTQDSQSDDDMDRHGKPYRTVERIQARGRDGYYDVYATRDGETVYRGEYNARDGVEEIPRAFPPPGADEYYPGGAADDYFRGGRARSANPSDYYIEEDRRNRNRSRPRGRRYDSESESSISPKPRNRRRDNMKDLAVAGATAGAGAYAANRELRDSPRSPRDRSANQQVARRDGNQDRTRDNHNDSGDDSDSSSILSSSEDERQARKMRHKAMLTAGLATVATIHAASGVYASMEAREARYKAVKEGKLSPDEAKREQNKARLQDLAALGIAALGIKGAVGKWQATTQHHKKYREHKKTRQERHQKRLERQQRYARSGGGGGRDEDRLSPYNGPYTGGAARGADRPGYNRTFSTSEPDLHYRGRDGGRDGGRDRNVGGRYVDGNPYGAYGQR